MKHIIKTEKQMLNFGQMFAKKLKGGDVVLLQGDLGSGKTVFTKGIAKGLGIKKNITSPTFILFKIYSVKGHESIKDLVHADSYRLEHGKDLINAGLDEYLNRNDMVVVVEWGERVKNLVGNKKILIKFRVLNDERREVVF